MRPCGVRIVGASKSFVFTLKNKTDLQDFCFCCLRIGAMKGCRLCKSGTGRCGIIGDQKYSARFQSVEHALVEGSDIIGVKRTWIVQIVIILRGPTTSMGSGTMSLETGCVSSVTFE